MVEVNTAQDAEQQHVIEAQERELLELRLRIEQLEADRGVRAVSVSEETEVVTTESIATGSELVEEADEMIIPPQAESESDTDAAPVVEVEPVTPETD